MSLLVASCNFFDDGKIDEPVNKGQAVSSVTLQKGSLSIKVGQMQHLGVSISPASARGQTVTWTYNKEIISLEQISGGAVITGLKEGQTTLIAECGGQSAACIINVSGYTEEALQNVEPYITSSQSILQLSKGDTDKLSVSLYNGSASDIDGYSWTVVDNQNVLALSPTGQHCIVTAKEDGYARVKVTHNKASHPYYFGIYVFADISKTTYITTTTNIVTLRADAEKTVSVSLQNPATSNYQSGFQWQVLTSDGSDSGSLSMTANGAHAILRGLKSGQATVRVTHPDAGQYPLDITVRTVEIVENVYIEPSETVAIVDGTAEKTITASLVGLSEGSQYNPDDFVWEVPQNDVISSYSHASNLYVTGLKNGSVTVTVSHPKSGTKREILVITQNQSGGAVDASVYITTSQNLVKTKVGATETTLNILLKGGDTGDEKDFTWKVSQSPASGSGDVIKVETTHGTVSSRAAAQTVAAGLAHITPLAEGTATITLGHPKAHYTTEVLVKVLPAHAVLEEQMYLTGAGIARFLNSEEYTYTVGLGGASASASDENDTRWESDKPTLNIASSGREAVLTSTGTGSIITNMTLTHPKAESPKKVLVLTADTEEELAAMKAFYSDKMYHSVNVEGTTNVYVSHIGFGSVDEASGDFVEEDFSTISWTSSKPQVAIVEKSSDNPLVGVVTGRSSGTADITASYQGVSVTFTVTVYPKGVDIGKVENTAYMTTSNNVVVMKPNGTKTVSVTAIGLSASQQNGIKWESNDTDVATVAANGQSTTITARSVGESIIQMKPNGNSKTISATLVNGDAADKYNFRWSLDNYDVVDISSTANTAIITPKQQGQVTLTVSHPKSAYDQQVIIKVSEYTQFGFGATSKVITEGKSTFINMQVPVTAVKCHVEYESTSPLVATAQGTASVCQLTALKPGIATIKAKLVATATNVVQATADLLVSVEEGASQLVYITAPTTIHTMERGTNKTLSATLTGSGVIATDQQNLRWESADPSVVTLRGASTTGIVTGQSAYVEAVNSGETTITVSHDKSDTALVFYIIVPGEEEKTVSLNKTYIIVEKGVGVDLTASIAGGKTDDYNNITWTADKVNGENIVRLLGTGKTVQVYGLAPGVSTVRAQLPNGKYATCDIEVQDSKTFSFGTTTVRVQPTKTVEVPYTVSPASAGLQWVQSDNTFVTLQDMGNDEGQGIVTITGVKEGNSTLSCVTSYGSKATLQVIYAWDEEFTINKTKLQGPPDKSYEIKFTVNPTDCQVEADECDFADITVVNNGDGTGIVTVVPTGEGRGSISLTATNPTTKKQLPTRSVNLDFKHDRITVIPSIISRDGSWSRYDETAGMIIMGDGESLNIGFGVKEKGVVVEDIKVEIQSGDNSRLISVLQNSSASQNGQLSPLYTLRHTQDTKDYQYRIIEGYVPQIYTGGLDAHYEADGVWEDAALDKFKYHHEHDGYDYRDGFTRVHGTDDHILLGLEGFTTWDVDDNGRGCLSDNYNERYCIEWCNRNHSSNLDGKKGKYFSRRREPSLDGKIMSVSEFESKAWYYCPAQSFESIHLPSGILTQHINAVKEISTDTSVKSMRQTDILRITVKRTIEGQGTEDRVFQIPIYTETRGCVYNQK